MRILIIAPGPTYSTYDMFKGYLSAFRELDVDVHAFWTHVALQYHILGTEAFDKEFDKGYTEKEHNERVFSRVARDLVVDILSAQPDVLFFVDGTFMAPGIFRAVSEIFPKLAKQPKIAVYLTEMPYAIGNIEESILPYVDYVFSNERSVVLTKDSEYLPHSIDPLIHYDNGSARDIDLFFCGTYFPKRNETILSLNLNGINHFLAGNPITGFAGHQEIANLLKSGIIPNSEVADYYRRSKIVLNIHRDLDTGHKNNPQDIAEIINNSESIGPRVLEASACGALVVTDYRKEIEEVFGDSVVVYTSKKDLNAKIRYYLDHEDERAKKAEEARMIASRLTYKNRSSTILDKLNTIEKQGEQKDG